MTVGRLAAIFGCLGPDLAPEERDFFRDTDPFGFILFARNVDNPVQLRRLTHDLREAVGRDAPILIDQEGGRVQRMRAPHWREWLPPLDMARLARDPVQAMWLRGRIIAHELRGVGIDANCAPCADVARPETHPFLRNRCLSDDPRQVATLARSLAEGQADGGVLSVVKHLPGHGRATADSHKDLPRVTAPMVELIETDFAPFRALNDLPMAMTGHMVFDAIDPENPTTQSAAMISVIRDQIGFSGLLMTDDLNMLALSGDLTSRTARSMAAGCDLALHCKGDLAEMQVVAAACGDMGPATLDRAERALLARKAPGSVDITALEATLRAIMPGEADVV